MPPTRQMSFGVPLYPFQALDVIGPVDVLSTASHDMLSQLLPEAEVARLNPYKITFHYIASDDKPQLTTGNISIAPTTTFSACPKLDYMLLGGPSPEFASNLPADLKSFIIERSTEVKIIFTTCTGGLVLGATGLLDGVHATVNHILVDAAKQISPTTKWDRTTHWVIADGPGDLKFWTAAGAGAGMDMFAHWLKTEMGQDLLNYSTSLLEWQPRNKEGQALESMNGRGEMIVGLARL